VRSNLHTDSYVLGISNFTGILTNISVKFMKELLLWFVFVGVRATRSVVGNTVDSIEYRL
jgi:hypothetical protein